MQSLSPATPSRESPTRAASTLHSISTPGQQVSPPGRAPSQVLTCDSFVSELGVPPAATPVGGDEDTSAGGFDPDDLWRNLERAIDVGQQLKERVSELQEENRQLEEENEMLRALQRDNTVARRQASSSTAINDTPRDTLMDERRQLTQRLRDLVIEKRELLLTNQQLGEQLQELRERDEARADLYRGADSDDGGEVAQRDGTVAQSRGLRTSTLRRHRSASASAVSLLSTPRLQQSVDQPPAGSSFLGSRRMTVPTLPLQRCAASPSAFSESGSRGASPPFAYGTRGQLAAAHAQVSPLPWGSERNSAPDCAFAAARAERDEEMERALRSASELRAELQVEQQQRAKLEDQLRRLQQEPARRSSSRTRAAPARPSRPQLVARLSARAHPQEAVGCCCRLRWPW